MAAAVVAQRHVPMEVRGNTKAEGDTNYACDRSGLQAARGELAAAQA